MAVRRRKGAASNTTKQIDETNKEYATTAPPPWHAVATLSLFVVISGSLLPSLEKLDEIAAMSHFTRTVFPGMTLVQLACCRGFIAALIWWTILYNSVLSNGWDQVTPYLPASKLKRIVNRMVGFKTLYPFTSWSWMILGLSFTLSSYISWRGSQGGSVHRNVLRVAVICWEIAAPCALLVAAVVRYAIWPAVLRHSTVHGLNSWRNVMMHNMNVVFALTESCLLSGLSVRWSEAALAPLWGCLYVVFSWNMTTAWNAPEHGPQFIYFFMDTTLPGYYCTIALLVLLVVLLFFFGVFSVLTTQIVMGQLPEGVLVHVLFVLAASSCVMRFRN